MISHPTKRRLAENEVYFRKFNEKVQTAIDEVNKIAKEDNVDDFGFDADSLLFFSANVRMKSAFRRYNYRSTNTNGHINEEIVLLSKKGTKFLRSKLYLNSTRTTTWSSRI